MTWLANRKHLWKARLQYNFPNRGHFASRFSLIMNSPTIKQACTRPFHTSFDKLLNNLSIWLGNGDKLSQLTVFVAHLRLYLQFSPDINTVRFIGLWFWLTCLKVFKVIFYGGIGTVRNDGKLCKSAVRGSDRRSLQCKTQWVIDMVSQIVIWDSFYFDVTSIREWLAGGLVPAM